MIVDRCDPVNLFVLVPQLMLPADPELAALDRLLTDDALFAQVRADLCRRVPHSVDRGRPSTPVEVILRMLIVRRLYAWSYEETESLVADSLVLRHFCRVYLQAVPDDTTLLRWAQLIQRQTLTALNDHVVELARTARVTRGRKLRIDSTVVEAAFHYPTDSSLLADGVRVLSRLLQRAKAAVGGGRPALLRDRTRSAKRLAHQIGKAARYRGQRRETEHLIAHGEGPGSAPSRMTDQMWHAASGHEQRRTAPR